MSEGLTQEPRFEKACKICQFSKAEEESEEKQVYDFAIQLVKEGASYGKVGRDLKELAKRMKFSVKTPSRKSAWNHFEKHSTALQHAQIHVAREEWIPKEDNPLVDYKMIEKITKGNFDEYDELCRLYSKFKEVSNKIYEFDISLKIGVPNAGEQWSQNKIQTFTSMVNTQKSILSEISKMRQGDKLVAIAAKFIIEQFTSNLVHKLKSEFDSFVAIMKRTKVDPDVIEAFENMAGYRVASLFTEEAGSAMALTRREFKLPN